MKRRRKIVQFTMVHNNFNVSDLERSLAFYKAALGLEPVQQMAAPDGSFRLANLGDGKSQWHLELTWLRDHPQKYDLGENEIHLAFRTDDYAAAHALHKTMGCICYENTSMGLYFIEDPDGYWLEIVPNR
jgi:lactoylglutathione lyase